MMDHSLLLSTAMFTRGCHSRRKSQKQVIFIEYIWRLQQVYHVCINLLLQQRNVNAKEFAARREKAAEKKEEHVIDLTIKPLNITITTTSDDDARRSENCLNTRFIIVDEEAVRGFSWAARETWK